MMKKLFFSLVFLISTASVFAFTPKNVECIAPAGPGGGWDFTCRFPAGEVMTKLGLIPGTLRTTNMAGGGGGLAYANVVTKRAKDDNLLVAASVATATRLAQNVFSGFTADNVRWLGALGADYGVIAVAKDSKYKTLNDLMDALKKDPKSLNFVGGSAAGGWDHLKVLMLADESGVKNLKEITYVAFDGGGPAMIELLGGRADAFTGDTSEVLSQLDAGNIRILAVLSEKRVSRLGDAKTAKEQGLNVIGANWRAFYAPPKMSDDAYNYWVDAIKKTAASKEWADLRDKNGLAEFESFGPEFEKFVLSQIAKVSVISKDLGLIK